MGKGKKPSGPERFTISSAGDQPIIDRHDLYQKAVQHPPGDIYWMNKFYCKYISPEAPHHLREDCGTAFLSSTWCKQDPCRTATGVDIDAEVLQWAVQHNVDNCSDRICLVQANVLQLPQTGKAIHPHPQQQQQQQPSRSLPSGQAASNGTAPNCQHDHQQRNGGASCAQQQPPPSAPQGPHAAAAAAAAMNHADTTNTAQSTTHNNDQAVAEQSLPWSPQSSEERLHHTDLTTKPCDIICAFNFSVCLLHKRHEVLQYFRNVHSALCVEPGGLFVMDLMGGHSVEAVRSYKRIHFKTGIRYTFEQERYNPLTRNIRCHISLKDPQSKRVLKRAFTYNWRLWSVVDLVEMLKEAGFNRVHVWAKPKGSCAADPTALDAAGEDGSATDGQNEGQDGDSTGSVDEDDFEAELAPYLEYNPSTASTPYLDQLAKGWTAYVVGVVKSG